MNTIVPFDLKNLSVDEIKKTAKNIKKVSGARSCEIYESLAKSAGFKSWNVFIAFLKNK